MADYNHALQMSAAFNNTQAMQASVTEHGEKELRKNPGQQPFSVKISRIDLDKLRHLDVIEGLACEKKVEIPKPSK